MVRRSASQIVFDVRFLDPSLPEYRAWGRAQAERGRRDRPAWAGARRDAGEMLGMEVERHVGHLLEGAVGASEPRILSWRTLEGARAKTLYREIDFVTRPDADTLVLWEIKSISAEGIARGRGLKQLAASAALVAEGPEAGKRLLRRLVYVAEPAEVCEGAIPIVSPHDLEAEIGAVFVPPAEVERAALAVGRPLPHGWASPRAAAEEVAALDPPAPEPLTALALALRALVL